MIYYILYEDCKKIVGIIGNSNKNGHEYWTRIANCVNSYYGGHYAVQSITKLRHIEEHEVVMSNLDESDTTLTLYMVEKTIW